MVGNGLAMRCDRVDAVEGNSGLLGDAERGIGEALAESDIESGELPENFARRDPPCRDLVDPILKLRRKRLLACREQPERAGRLVRRPLDEGGVDPVGGRSRHQPDHAHAAQSRRSLAGRGRRAARATALTSGAPPPIIPRRRRPSAGEAIPLGPIPLTAEPAPLEIS